MYILLQTNIGRNLIILTDALKNKHNTFYFCKLLLMLIYICFRIIIHTNNWHIIGIVLKIHRKIVDSIVFANIKMKIIGLKYLNKWIDKDKD